MDIITTALPYANGPLHCGHILEAILADIRVRYLRSMQRKVIFLSGQDAHGAAIMISAQKQRQSEVDYINDMHALHVQTYAKASVVYDCFSSTHTETNRKITLDIYKSLQAKGYVKEVTVSLPYDPSSGMFLADRFLSGQCPRCTALEQYGDHCEVCGATYASHELINPVSRESNHAIAWQSRVHVVVALEQCRQFLQTYLADVECLMAVKHKLEEWFNAPLRDWDITRNGPYFGFEIPDRQDQYFYVWLDAPCGYLAALQDFLKEDQWSVVRDCWNNAHITHVIGKDITYFHGLFWPAMLYAHDLKMPDAMFTHGFVTLKGDKMSKSKGTFILAENLLDGVGSDALRYYLATKLSEGIADIDICCDDFISKVHSDLIGKCINLGSRLSGFVHRCGHGVLSEPMDTAWLDDLREQLMGVHDAYEKWDYATVGRVVMKVCDDANAWVDQHKPWALAKTDSIAAWQVSSTALQVYRWALMALQPICPNLAGKGLDMFEGRVDLSDGFDVLLKSEIKQFVPLMQRYDREVVSRLFGESE